MSTKPADYHDRRRWQDEARARGDVPECGRGACTSKAEPAWVNSGTPLLYCGGCARSINGFSVQTLGYELCAPEVVQTSEAT
jgi:hypothetical protein